jgi:hypothetical protein
VAGLTPVEVIMAVMGWLRGLLRPKAPDADATRAAMAFVGRARLIVHLFESFGEEGSTEFGPPAEPGYQDLLFFAFAPTDTRSWWTYATAGLSLCPALDHLPPTELLAYSLEPREELVELLLQLALRPPGAIALAAGDIVTFDTPAPLPGLPPCRHFGFVQAPESPALRAFPAPAARPEDERYILARPGESRAEVRFLRVVPLLDGDATRFAQQTSALGDDRSWTLR